MMSDTHRALYWHQEGPVRRRGREDPATFRIAWAVRTGRGRVFCTDRHTPVRRDIYASSCNPFFGMKVLVSTDLGKKFKETKSAPAFPKDDGRALANIWSLEAGDRQEGSVVRRRTGVAVPQQRRRRLVGDGLGHQQPRARPAMATRQRRTLHAHHPPRRQPHAPRAFPPAVIT